MQPITLLVLHLLFIQSIPSNGCMHTETDALLNFKASMDDPSNRLASWTGTNCCTWIGITCNNQTSHVVKLNLGNPEYDDRTNSLCGEIGTSLLALDHLEYLDLSYNQFFGKIPEFIGSLRELTYINFSNTGLSGMVPPHIGNLSRLEYLDLSNFLTQKENLYISDMRWLSDLTALKHLDISGVDLLNSKEWMQALNMLPSLEVLALYQNNLTTIPSSISFSNLSSLTKFTLQENNFSTNIPDWLGKLIGLVELEITDCSFTGQVPNSFGNLTLLNKLTLSESNLNGAIPPLHNLHNLTYLYLVDINIGGDIFNEIMSKLSNDTWSSLQVLFLSNMNLTGKLTGWLHKLVNLSYLDLSRNHLNGSIPAEIGSFTNLVSLDLSYNSFTGVLTHVHLSSLSKLRTLYLAFNSLTIRLGTEWMPPFELEHLALNSCDLGPKFPAWLENQTRITYLDLSKTGIVDSLPDWFWNLSSLVGFDLSDNQISGRLPINLENLINLTHIILRNNKFHREIFSLPGKLQTLDLSSNNFSGTLCAVSSSLRKLKNLTVFQLRNNSLIGKIPPELKFCPNLTILDLGENMFSGEIPEWIGENIPNLLVLRLVSNNLSGNIPSKLTLLKNLHVLDLAENHLSGSIPSNLDDFSAMSLDKQDANNNVGFMGFDISDSMFYNISLYVIMKGLDLEYSNTLPQMRSVDLSVNDLTGEIPRSIVALTGLRNLNFSHNHLSGIIPAEIGKMQSLESLDLGMNNLSGTIPESMSELTFLEKLNLSYNNLSGNIPLGNQLQTLNDPDIYVGNPNLCRILLGKSCSSNETYSFSSHKGDLELWWLYLFVDVGFVTGLISVLCVLLFETNWRDAYFVFMDDMFERLYVYVALSIARLRKK